MSDIKCPKGWNKIVDILPDIFQKVEVIVFEFGCSPIKYYAYFWKSSEDNQPLKFFLDEEIYGNSCPIEIGEEAHFWRARILENSETKQPNLFNKETE